jgi:hypothetical protein
MISTILRLNESEPPLLPRAFCGRGHILRPQGILYDLVTVVWLARVECSRIASRLTSMGGPRRHTE